MLLVLEIYIILKDMYLMIKWAEAEERSLWTIDDEESDLSSDLPFFTRNEIAIATDNFSLANKLGEGGFGSVYKVAYVTP